MEKSSQSYFKFLNQSTEAKSSQLLNPFQQKDLKDENASYDTLKMVFMPVAGAIYTELRDFCLKKYNEPK